MFAPSSCSVGKRNRGAIFKAQIMAENTENNKIYKFSIFSGREEDLKKLDADSMADSEVYVSFADSRKTNSFT